MDWVNIRSKTEAAIKKYRYVLLVVAVGIVLMLVPTTGKKTVTDTTAQTAVSTQQLPEEKLQTILQKVNGAGRVEVMLTVASGEETVYQTDIDQTDSSDNSSVTAKTVIISGADREEKGLISQVHSPVYLGAVVVCDGADDPAVRLSIVDAVCKATGLGADKISVLKMK